MTEQTKILVVEDDLNLAEMLSTYFRAEGYSVVAVSWGEDAIDAVPKSYRDGALAMGATHWQTIWRVVLPAARSGLVIAVMLGIARAIGETEICKFCHIPHNAIVPEPLWGHTLSRVDRYEVPTIRRGNGTSEPTPPNPRALDDHPWRGESAPHQRRSRVRLLLALP